YCCRQGGERFAFLTGDELARIRGLKPEMDAAALLAYYWEALPEASVEEACVYQGPKGCVLDREMRAEICNSFHCRELIEAFARVRAAPDAPVVVLARSDAGTQAVGALGRDKAWRLL
ncbi:MAG: hypothetical protein AAFY59_09705, partial [Pseudomonadota bacterium]